MKHSISRRHFLGAAATAAASVGFLSGTRFAAAQEAVPAFPSKLYKGQIIGAVTEELCVKMKEAGFEGFETSNWNVSVDEAKQCRLLAEKHGLRIHGVMRGWATVNIPDKYEESIASVITALEAASAYGADTVLLVPCRVDPKVLKMPEPWDFDVDFDPKTLKAKTVAAGDNAPYADYITAQNYATEQTIRAVESVIPVAAKVGVRLTLENVWNHLWCTPKFFAGLIKYFDNPWLGAYFDLGNHTKYARCEEWLKELGHSIIKLHIKGFKVDEVKGKLGGGPGQWCGIDEASIDWKAVRKLLADIRYNGWVSVEERKYDYPKYSEILDKFFAGELKGVS